MKKVVHSTDHDILENPVPFGEECFKANEEMVFDTMAARRYCWCDDIKRGSAFKGDFATYVKPGAFCLQDC